MNEEYKQVVVVNNELKMGRGKICSQVAHASLSAFLKTDVKEREEWIKEGMKKIILKGDKKTIVLLFNKLKRKFPCSLIKDAGKTQIKPGSITALGIGPIKSKEIDVYIKEMKLL